MAPQAKTTLISLNKNIIFKLNTLLKFGIGFFDRNSELLQDFTGLPAYKLKAVTRLSEVVLNFFVLKKSELLLTKA